MQVKPKEEAAPKVQALEDKKDEALKVSVAGPLGGPKYDKKQFKKDWRSEWKNGDFPSWKETYPKAALKFEDRQSDGKIGNFLLEAAPKVATEAEAVLKEQSEDKVLEALDAAADKLADRALKLGEEAAKDGASDEAKKAADQAQKDFEEADANVQALEAPNANVRALEEEDNEEAEAETGEDIFDEEEEEKEEDEKDDDDDDEDTDEKEDKFGDLLQVEDKVEAAPKVQAFEEKKKNEDEEQEGENEQDEDDEDDRDEEDAEEEDADEDEEEKEHNKEETPKVATKANFLQKGTPQKEAAPEIIAAASAEKAEVAPGPAYSKKAYSKEWRSEWKNGDIPSWKETYPKAALPYEDRQSDGKVGN